MNQKEYIKKGDMQTVEGITIFTEQDIIPYQDVLNKPFKPDESGFFLVTQGFMRFQCNLETITCSKGSLYFTAAQRIYLIEEISADFTYTGIIIGTNYLLQNGIHVTGSELFMLSESTITSQYILNGNEMNVLTCMLSLVKDKIQQRQSPYFMKEVLQYMILAIMYETIYLFKKYNDVGNIKLNRKEDLTAQFLDLLQNNVKSERGLQFYASMLSVTTGHLTKVIKQVIGKNASELIDAAVITEAKILLGNPATGVAQVAEELQFPDQSFFGKYFKKHTGMSPSAYKKWVRKADNNLF